MQVLKFLYSEDGATAVEYAVMLGVILLAAIVGISAFGGNTGGLWGGINSDLNATPFGGS
jgi:Flp pilus assembly pilin Flp